MEELVPADTPFTKPKPKSWGAVDVPDLNLLGFLNRHGTEPQNVIVLERKMIDGLQGSALLIYNPADE